MKVISGMQIEMLCLYPGPVSSDWEETSINRSMLLPGCFYVINSYDMLLSCLRGCVAYHKAHSHSFHFIFTKTWPVFHRDWLHIMFSWVMVSYQQSINCWYHPRMVWSVTSWPHKVQCTHRKYMGRSGWHKYGTPLCKRTAWEPQWLHRNDSAAHHNPTRQQPGQSALSTDTSRPPPRQPDETQSQASLTISCSTHRGGSAHIPAT